MYLREMAGPTLKDLLEKGYFPEVIPPSFTTERFGLFAAKNPGIFDAFVASPNRLKGIHYSASKSGFRRRPFVVTHPVSQFFVAKFVADNWKSIDQHFKKSKFSASIPEADDEGTRSVKITPFNELHRIMHERVGQFGHIAKSDIQRYFPSLYTHSIPWAIHGKENAKKDISPNSKDVPFNKLDQLVRRGQDGQTVGIPIGPDTSRIIAEIIGCSIDQRLVELAPKQILDGVRHVDDFYFGADSYSDAEACVAALRVALREFGLEINDTKTDIHKSSSLRDDNWPRLISRRLAAYKKSNDDIFSLFEETFDIAERTKNEAPVRYLLRRADKLKVFEDDHWGVTENFLIKCIYNFPHSTDYVSRIIVRRGITHDDLNRNKWARAIGNRLMTNSKMGHDHEICWLLWTATSLLLPLANDVATEIIAYSNPMVALMGAQALSRKLIDPKLDVSAWESHIHADQLADEWWMFAYECSLRGWLKANLKDAALKGTIFEFLKKSNVSFYDDMLPSEYEEYFDEEGAIPSTGFGYEDGEDEDEEADF
jgi:hypothetical protein